MESTKLYFASWPIRLIAYLVKGLLFGLLYALTLGILFLLDNLWPLWDDDNQTLHDKVVGTYVVYIPRG